MNFPITKASLQYNQNEIRLIHIDPALDIKQLFRRQFDENEPTFHEHHQSHMRMIYEDQELRQKLNVIHYGLQGHKVREEDVDYIKSFADLKANLVYL